MIRRVRRAAGTVRAFVTGVAWLTVCSSVALTRREELEHLRRVAGVRLVVEVGGLPVVNIDAHSLYLVTRYGGYPDAGAAGVRGAELLQLAGAVPLVIRTEVPA